MSADPGPGQGYPQALVDYYSQRLSATSDLGGEADRDIVIEGQSSSHNLMLLPKQPNVQKEELGPD